MLMGYSVEGKLGNFVEKAKPGTSDKFASARNWRSVDLVR